MPAKAASPNPCPVARVTKDGDRLLLQKVFFARMGIGQQFRKLFEHIPGIFRITDLSKKSEMRPLTTTRRNFAWQFWSAAVPTKCSLKNDGHVRPLSPQPNAWEPRENRGRLRHCYGLQTPRATGFALARPGRRE